MCGRASYSPISSICVPAFNVLVGLVRSLRIASAHGAVKVRFPRIVMVAPFGSNMTENV